MEKKNKISVVIATYNCAETLQDCLDSIYAQTYPDIDIVVIDGGSKDATVQVIRSNEEYLGYWISEPDRGIYDAWNKAIIQAKGEWVYFLGADDVLHAPDFLPASLQLWNRYLRRR